MNLKHNLQAFGNYKKDLLFLYIFSCLVFFLNEGITVNRRVGRDTLTSRKVSVGSLSYHYNIKFLEMTVSVVQCHINKTELNSINCQASKIQKKPYILSLYPRVRFSIYDSINGVHKISLCHFVHFRVIPTQKYFHIDKHTKFILSQLNNNK